MRCAFPPYASCILYRSTKSPERKREYKKRRFRNGQKWRTGAEGRISVVKRRHGLNRSRYKGDAGMQRWVGLGVIADTWSTSAASSPSSPASNPNPTHVIPCRRDLPAGRRAQIRRTVVRKHAFLRRKVVKRKAEEQSEFRYQPANAWAGPFSSAHPSS
jgi:hypothetical protein